MALREIEKQEQETKFVRAAIEGDFETCKSLSNDIDVHAENDEALKGAADGGYLDIVKFLINNYKWKLASLEEALLLARESERFSTVDYLISKCDL